MRSNQSFSFLWAGQSLANFADVLYLVALITLIYQNTGSATYSALVPIFRVGGSLISSIIAPLILDRFRLRNILLASQLGQTILFLILPLSITYLLQLSPMSIFILVFSIAFLDGWTSPARNALIPRLVAPDQLVKANSLISTTDQTLQFVGWAFGGLLVVYLSGMNTLWISFALLIASTFSLLFVQDQTEEEKKRTETHSNWHSIREGWLFIGKHPTLRTLTTMNLLEGIGNGVWIGAILLVYVKEILHQGEQWWGFINASFFAGSILGGLCVLMFAKWVNRRVGLSIVMGAFLSAAFTLLFALTSVPWIALVLSALMGIPNQLRDISQETIFQKKVPSDLLPKVYSAQGALSYSTFGISVLIMGYVSDQFGVFLAFLVSVFLFGGSALLALVNVRHLK